MSETLYIVDTFSLVFQVFHAIRQPMTGTRGQPTNAVFGFTGDLEHLLNDKQPTHLILAMESPEPGERLQIYQEYKAHREEMPQDLRPQIPMILDVVGGYRIPVISHSGWEADDVLATLTRQAAERGMEVRIVTNDKDARQLIGPKVKLYNIRKKQFMDESALQEDWGIRPDQVVDFQSLVGDAVDNVPGVPKIGPKTATTLLQQFGTLEEVLANADKAKGKVVSENLKNFADQALMSRELVRLRTDLPLAVDWEAAKVKEPDWKRLYDLFTDFGFRRYANEAQMKLKNAPLADARETGRHWETLRTEDAFDKFIRELSGQKKFCFDLETTSQDPLQADIVGWAFSWHKDQGYYIPVDGPKGSQTLKSSLVLEKLKPILADPEREVLNQNIKYDLLVLRRAGGSIGNIGLDTMVGDYLLDAGARSHSLEELSKKYLQRAMIPISDLIGKGKQQLKMFEVDVDKAAEYASEDADVTWQIAEIIEPKLKSEGLWDLYWDLERPLISVLAEMEERGIRIDVAELKRQSEALSIRLQVLMGEIHELAGREFNIDSPKQLAKVLFEDLQLPVVKRTKTGPSTDQEVLEKLAEEHPLPEKLTEHRQLTKLRGTYLDALPNLINPFTGRLHTSFSQTTAATGRLSSSEPNLQNIPVRTEEGRLIRRAFLPTEDSWKLVSLDYSQIELRILAHFCQDESLLNAFRKGEDIHATVAAQVYGVPVAEVTSAMRRVAKAVNFGVIYGQTSFGLAAALKISKEEAGKFIDDYFCKYRGVVNFVEATLDECHRTGYARTILGRRREITGIRPRRFGNLNLPERTAVNTVIQGSAADLIKKAMLNVSARFETKKTNARMLLQIHDELLFEAPASEVHDLITLVRSEMENALKLDVPVVVDAKSGANWLDVE